MPDIIGIGDTNVDLMIQVDHIPSHDEKVRGRLLGKFPGGIIGNFCSAAAKLGTRTGIIAKIGKDVYGEICLNDFEQRGIDTTAMVVDHRADTYFCIVHLDATGEKALTIVQTSGFLPQKHEIDLKYARTGRYVHMTTLDVELADYVFGMLQGAPCKLSLDIEPTASKVGQEVWQRLLPRLDIAFPNEAGLAAITKTEDIDAGAKYLLDCGVKMVVVTCGIRGVIVFTKSSRHEQPGFPVEVLDTTGAGDCFNATFITSLIRDMEVRLAAKYAAAAAAISIGKVGAREGLPTWHDIEEFLRYRGEAV